MKGRCRGCRVMEARRAAWAQRPRSRKAVTDGLALVLRLFLEVRRAAATYKGATGTTPWPLSKTLTVRALRQWPNSSKAVARAAYFCCAAGVLYAVRRR